MGWAEGLVMVDLAKGRQTGARGAGGKLLWEEEGRGRRKEE